MPTFDTRHRPAEYLTTVIESVIIVVSVAYVLTGSLPALIVWESIAAMYLLIGFLYTRRRSLTGHEGSGRTGVLDTLSWVLPLAASLVGISSAIHVLVVRALNETAQGQGIVLALAASLAIIISWHLLHTGFAQIYETSLARRSDEPGLTFPANPAPGFADFLYFSFTIGTSFATSDVTVNTSRMRWTVLVHSITSFFYNALVVAVAFQVLQQLAGS
ncbi:DUF1345 domain-containing protein [Arthrobacter sp. HS15c]|uniref:DUF1345 domain-containing protein n=1 Tax=Arthrobacter sp. HS15c TaxID=3230279 RepID=UPI003467B8AB